MEHDLDDDDVLDLEKPGIAIEENIPATNNASTLQPH
jgi:hypothetical protein